MNEIAKVEQKKSALVTGGKVAGIVPANIEEAFRLSDAINQSGMAPYGLDTPQKIMIAMLAGMELGMPAMQSVQSVAVINNRPCIWGDALIGVIRSSRDCEYVKEWIEGEGDSMVAWCETKRRGEDEPVRKSFSVDDAKRAGLWQTQARVTKQGRNGSYEKDNDSPWYKYPKRMLQMRARAWCLRDTYADILKGMQVREEVEDFTGPEKAKDVTPQQPPLHQRLEQARTATQDSQDEQEGFDLDHVSRETETRSSDDQSDDQSPTPSSDEGDETPLPPSSPSTHTEAGSSLSASDEGGGETPASSPSLSPAAITKAVELMRYVKFLRDDIPGGLDDKDAAIAELNTKAKGRFEESDFPALSKIKGWCIDAIKGDCEIEQVAEMAGEMFGVPVEQFEKKEAD